MLDARFYLSLITDDVLSALIKTKAKRFRDEVNSPCFLRISFFFSYCRFKRTLSRQSFLDSFHSGIANETTDEDYVRWKKGVVKSISLLLLLVRQREIRWKEQTRVLSDV